MGLEQFVYLQWCNTDTHLSIVVGVGLRTENPLSQKTDIYVSLFSDLSSSDELWGGLFKESAVHFIDVQDSERAANIACSTMKAVV